MKPFARLKAEVRRQKLEVRNVLALAIGFLKRDGEVSWLLTSNFCLLPSNLAFTFP